MDEYIVNGPSDLIYTVMINEDYDPTDKYSDPRFLIYFNHKEYFKDTGYLIDFTPEGMEKIIDMVTDMFNIGEETTNCFAFTDTKYETFEEVNRLRDFLDDLGIEEDEKFRSFIED